ncbi:MAG: hypothetical protein K1X64_04280 [Myxococcaceae bacterium]|nr:hypothetical protein [Myxococcaceae bacterium]
MKPLALLSCFLFATSSCLIEPVLVPDRTAQRVRGNTFMAFTEVNGVRIYADGTAWRGEPQHLAQVLTPVSLSIQNVSGRPVRVSYADMQLVGSSGFVYPAMAPMPGRGTVSSVDPVVEPAADFHRTRPVRPFNRPRFHHYRFWVAPHYQYYYPGYYTWPNRFGYDPGYYDRVVWPQPLPTDDMLAEALPEGVLQNGGSVQGFVYFQLVTEREAQVRLELKLFDADTNEALGTASLPFAVRARY